MSFKQDFVWGAATAAYQVEGAAFEDGKGLSIWDVFAHEPGRIFENHHGDVACDQYHRFKEDVALMKAFHSKAYRFSISWARVLPDGIGKVNEAGLAYYDQLVDELLANGITPYVTLYHWDLPYELYKRGGWLNPDCAKWFSEYAKVIVERLSDRVQHFMTFNEPQVFLHHGHIQAHFAPGTRYGMRDIMTMVHNVLRSHGAAVEVIRKCSKGPVQVGFAPTTNVAFPKVETPENIEAARREMFEYRGTPTPAELSWSAGLWMDPVFLGKYPKYILDTYGAFLPENYEEDMKSISQELDFFGINIYTGRAVEADEKGNARLLKRKVGFDVTGFNWDVIPQSLYWGPKFFYERYKKPIIITENGLSNKDWVSPDGKVHDIARIDFLRAYLQELRRAATDGVDIAGYFQWSLMDNFEWSSGYNERFGLIHVDFETQKRTLKDSAYWYKEVIDSNGENL